MFSMQQNRNVFISPTASICDWFWHSNINYLLWSSCLFILHFSRSLCLSCRHICIFFLSLSLCQPLLCSAQLISLDVPLLNVFIRILFSLFTATEAINCSADPVNSPCHDVLLSLVFFFWITEASAVQRRRTPKLSAVCMHKGFSEYMPAFWSQLPFECYTEHLCAHAEVLWINGSLNALTAGRWGLVIC